MDTKFLLKSKTIWGIIIMIIPAVCQIAGIEPPAATDLQNFGDTLFSVINGVCYLGGAVIAVYGRIVAKTQLKVTK